MSDDTEIVLLPKVEQPSEIAPMVRDVVIADQVRRLAQLGMSRLAIYEYLRLPKIRFEKLYMDDFVAGQMEASRKIASWAMEAAEAGSVPMIMFLCKTRLGWNETSVVEHIGEVRSVVSSQPMTREQFVKRYIDKEGGEGE